MKKYTLGDRVQVYVKETSLHSLSGTVTNIFGPFYDDLTPKGYYAYSVTIDNPYTFTIGHNTYLRETIIGYSWNTHPIRDTAQKGAGKKAKRKNNTKNL
jgi:hypothetical protein